MKPYSAYKKTGLQWLESIPVHWKIVQSRRLFSQRKDKAAADELQLTASQKHGVVYQADYMALEGARVVQVIKGADILKHVEPNDFVISMRSFQGGIEWSGLRGSISSAYVMLIPSDNVCAPYFKYLLKSNSYIQALQSTSDLIRDGQALRFENFSQIDLPVVPHSEQQAIASYLDRETTRIDALISKKTRFIELLREKRQAMITQAVTKGLDPTAKMKDSGVEWLGGMPDQWTITPIKHVLNGLIDTEHKTVTFFDDGDYLVVRTTNIKNGQLVLSGAKYTDVDGFTEWTKRGAPQPGDILFTREAPAGEACIVPANVKLCVGQRTVLMRTIQSKINPKFCLWSLYGGIAAEFIDILSQGSTVAHFNMGDIGSIPILLPPLLEQDAIASHLDYETSRMDTLITKTERSIELLKERRSALITAAVTGQIDLREAA